MSDPSQWDDSAERSDDLRPGDVATPRRPAELSRVAADVSQGELERLLQRFALERHAIVAITDARGRIRYVNDRLCQISQYAREELIGRYHRIVDSAGYHPRSYFRSIYATVTRGEVWRGEIRHQTKDGRIYWVDTTISPFKDKDAADTITRYVVIGADITERKRVEAQLRSRARQQEVVVALGHRALSSAGLKELVAEAVRRVADTLEVEHAGILELEPDGQSLLLSAGAGWADGLVGHARVGVGPDSAVGFTLMAGEPVVVTDVDSEKRFSWPHPLGEHGLVSGLSVPITGHPRPYGVLGVFARHRRDFTADDVHFLRVVANVLAAAVRQRRSEQALRDGQARLRAVLTTLVDGIITIDERGTIESVNPAAERLFGYTADELVGENVRVLMPEPYRREHDGYVANYLRTGQPRIIGIGREVIGRRKDGSVFPMDLAVSEFRVGDRRMFTGIVRDITERRRLEREILEAADDEQRRIGQDLHDGLCQHLTGVAMALEVATQRLAARSAPETADLNRIAEFVDQAITQARDLARGLQPVTLDRRGLASALKALAAKAEELFRVRCVLVCDGPCDLPDNNMVATHLYRIAQEAINNAVRHGKARTVVIDLDAGGDTVRLAVKDDGIGLPAAAGDAPGMGLRTMAHRAHMIGGTLDVRPGDPGGTVVTCVARKGPDAAGVPGRSERARRGSDAARGRTERARHGRQEPKGRGPEGPGSEVQDSENERARGGRPPHDSRAPR